jgi:hypothetical protein
MAISVSETETSMVEQFGEGGGSYHLACDYKHNIVSQCKDRLARIFACNFRALVGVMQNISLDPRKYENRSLSL